MGWLLEQPVDPLALHSCTPPDATGALVTRGPGSLWQCEECESVFALDTMGSATGWWRKPTEEELLTQD